MIGLLCLKRLSLTAWSLIALAAGLGLGIIGHEQWSPAFARFGDIAKAIGGLWLAALQLTVLPLVVSHVLAAITRAGANSVGKLGVRAFGLFLIMLSAAGLFAIALAPPLIARFSIPSASIETLKGVGTPPVPAQSTAATPGSLSEWVSTLLPTNLLQAVLDGDIFTLLLFTICFALAVTRLSEERYLQLTTLFQGLAEAMLQVTRWVLIPTPIGVFALTYVLALNTGTSIGRILGAYVLIASALLLLFTVLLYPVTAIVGRTKVSTFARAVVPSQLVAVSTRSSIAALPALVKGAGDHMRLPAEGMSFILPVAVSLFKINRPISALVKLFLLAHVYSVPLRATTILVFLATVIVISFGTAGVPQSGPGFRTLPAYLAAGVPLEGLVILEGVETLPDIFKTMLNVTGDMSAATILTRSHRSANSHVAAVESSQAANEGVV